MVKKSGLITKEAPNKSSIIRQPPKTNMTDIIAIIALLLLGQFWWSAMQAREQALQAVLLYCQKMEITLLDDCVALTAAWFKRDKQGKWRAWRSYSFEFTVTGYERYQGKIILLGSQLESITTQPYRIRDDLDNHTRH